MIVLGLTGSIGMGKTTTANMFLDSGVLVHSADEAVHRLYATGGEGAAAIGSIVPRALAADGSVDRDRLRDLVSKTPDLVQSIEAAFDRIGKTPGLEQSIDTAFDRVGKTPGLEQSIEAAFDRIGKTPGLEQSIDTAFDRVGKTPGLVQNIKAAFDRVGKIPGLEQSIEAAFDRIGKTPISNLAESIEAELDRFRKIPGLEQTIEAELDRVGKTPGLVQNIEVALDHVSKTPGLVQNIEVALDRGGETPDLLQRIEAAIHPLVRADRDAFLVRAGREEADVSVLDVPLLFETGGDREVGKVLVVSAPLEIQRARVLARPGMTEDAFQTILARQMPDAEKRKRADYVVNTGAGLEPARAQVKEILSDLSG